MSYIGHSQDMSLLDSLYSKSATATSDTVYLSLQLKITETLASQNPDTALMIGMRTLYLSDSLSYKNLTAQSHKVLGIVYEAKEEYISALRHFLNAKELFTELGNNNELAATLMNIGYLHYLLENSEEANKNTQRALQLSKSLNDSLRVSGCYHNLGLIKQGSGSKREALEYFQKALDIKELSYSKDSSAAAAKYLVTTLDAIGSVYFDLKEYDRASEYYQRSRELRISLGNVIGLALSDYNLGANYFMAKNLEAAEQSYGNALAIAQDVGHWGLLAYIYDAMASLKNEQGEYNEALKYVNECLRIRERQKASKGYVHSIENKAEIEFKSGNVNAAIRLGNEFDRYSEYASANDIKEMYNLLVKAFEQKGDYKNAFLYNNKVQVLKDTINERKHREDRAQLSMKYDFEKVTEQHEKELVNRRLEYEAAKAKNQQTIITILVISLILTAVFSLLLYSVNNQRKRANQNLAEKNLELQSVNNQLFNVNKKLGVANQTLQQFTFAASHDLKERLRSVTSFSQRLRRDIDKGKDKKTIDQNLKFIVQNGKGMHKTLDDLLNFSNLENQGAQKEDIDFIELAIETAREFKEKDDSISIQFIGDFPEINANPLLLKQLIRNIIENSIKFKTDDRRVEISFSCKVIKGSCQFEIADNGRGVEANYLTDIFDPFYRLNKRSESGAGLGLAVCKKIVELYGGQIWAENNMGGGLSIFFTLPEAKENRATDAEAKTERSSS